jgi:Inner membrane component of T3SS, cytoplasmic domain
MSFRVFIYYCAVCGGWAALVGWLLGQLLAPGKDASAWFLWPPEAAHPKEWLAFIREMIQATVLGGLVGLGVGVADGLAGVSSAKQYPDVGLRGLVVGAIGCLAGLFGGGFFGWVVSRLDSDVLQVLVTVIGWTVTGLLIGASIGLYELASRMVRGGGAAGGVRKLVNGVLGGALGGFLGSILFLVFGKVLSLVLRRPSTELFSTSAWGFVALGLCIGLLIGLAQVILKEAWIKVESGFRPGRELILSKDEVVIGRGEGCDIGLFGDPSIERVHARITKKGNRYVVADAGTPAGTFVNDREVTQPVPLGSGDAIRVGKSVLRFGERAKRK